MSEQNHAWAEKAILDIAKSGLEEQKRSRRWNIIFKSIGYFYLGLILYFMFFTGKPEQTKTGGHVALVEARGMILEEYAAAAPEIIKALSKAFEHAETKAVLIAISSPGGSPVQSAYIYDEILRLREKYPEKKVYAVCEDMCTSAAYYVAASADEVYAAPASLVGSIGVLMNGFGANKVMEKIGVDRRLMTAGDLKGMMDPFSPVNDSEKALVQEMLDDVHQDFINDIKAARGERLTNDPQLFSGRFWTGNQALENGLIDGLGSKEFVAREVIGEENIVNFMPKGDWFQKLGSQLGTSVSHALKSWGQWEIL